MAQGSVLWAAKEYRIQVMSGVFSPPVPKWHTCMNYPPARNVQKWSKAYLHPHHQWLPASISVRTVPSSAPSVAPLHTQAASGTAQTLQVSEEGLQPCSYPWSDLLPSPGEGRTMRRRTRRRLLSWVWYVGDRCWRRRWLGDGQRCFLIHRKVHWR